MRQSPGPAQPERLGRRLIIFTGKFSPRHLSILMAFFCHCYGQNGMIMARDANPLKTEQITLSINHQTVWYLDRLVETGLYGNNRTEAARVAIYDHCKMLISQGSLEIAPRLPARDISISS
jgi:hypothetical protein